MAALLAAFLLVESWLIRRKLNAQYQPDLDLRGRLGIVSEAVHDGLGKIILTTDGTLTEWLAVCHMPLQPNQVVQVVAIEGNSLRVRPFF